MSVYSACLACHIGNTEPVADDINISGRMASTKEQSHDPSGDACTADRLRSACRRRGVRHARHPLGRRGSRADTPGALRPPATDDCNAATLASTISTVTTQLSTYFAAHPDANQALIDATRQPAFVAVGQFDDYIDAHPDQADELRAIQAPLAAFKDRCGLQVSPTDALTVLAEV